MGDLFYAYHGLLKHAGSMLRFKAGWSESHRENPRPLEAY